MRLMWLVGLCLGLGVANSASADIAELYGRADAVWAAQVSPDGANVALGCAPTGRPAVCIFSLTENAEPKVFYAGDEARVEDFYWASDKHLIGIVGITENVRTIRGMQQYDVRRAVSYQIETEETAILMHDQGAWVDLTGLVAICDARPDTIVMQTGYRPDEARYTGSRMTDLPKGIRTFTYDVDLDSGKSRSRPVRNVSVIQTVLGADCEPVVNVIYNDELQSFKVELAETRAALFERDDIDVWPMAALGLNNARDSLIVRADFEDMFGLYTISLANGEIAPLVYDGVELGNLGVLRDDFSDTVIGFQHTNHLREHYYIDDAFRALQSKTEGALPGTNVRVSSFTRNRDMFTLRVEREGHPADFYLYEAGPGSLSPLGSVAPHLAERTLPAITPKTYRARDGLEIPSYVVLPPGKSLNDGPFPTLIMPHGGPEARDTAAFDWWAQGMAEAGYAVIKPNFRGSDGYGSAFRDAGFGEFGGKMIDDIVDAITWAEAEGLSGPEGVCVVGGSYGGYAALMSALRAPGKVKCVISIAPVTNIYDQMGRYERDTARYRYWARYVGSDAFADRDEKRDITPLQRTGDFRAKVLMMHGKDDLIVRISQSRRFADEWGDRPGLTYVEMDGQDHYLQTTQARFEVLSQSLQHLSAHHPAN